MISRPPRHGLLVHHLSQPREVSCAPQARQWLMSRKGSNLASPPHRPHPGAITALGRGSEPGASSLGTWSRCRSRTLPIKMRWGREASTLVNLVEFLGAEYQFDRRLVTKITVRLGVRRPFSTWGKALAHKRQLKEQVLGVRGPMLGECVSPKKTGRCAAEGAAAIQICNSHPGPIHLLLTDLIMPG
jgi:hypothetical protein